jgi:hypothetical protein
MPLEAGTDVARDLASGLKGSPLIIGILLLNAMFLVLIWYSNNQASEQRHEEMSYLMERCLPAGRSP